MIYSAADTISAKSTQLEKYFLAVLLGCLLGCAYVVEAQPVEARAQQRLPPRTPAPLLRSIRAPAADECAPAQAMLSLPEPSEDVGASPVFPPMRAVIRFDAPDLAHYAAPVCTWAI